MHDYIFRHVVLTGTLTLLFIVNPNFGAFTQYMTDPKVESRDTSQNQSVKTLLIRCLLSSLVLLLGWNKNFIRGWSYNFRKIALFSRFFVILCRCVCVLWRILMSLDKPSEIKFALNSFHATWFQTTHYISLLFDVCAVIAVASFVLLFVSNLANCFEIWREEKSHTFLQIFGCELGNKKYE